MLRKINVPNTQWDDMGVLPPHQLRTFLGVNGLDPFSIKEEYATSLKNLTSSGYPGLKVRSGYSRLGALLPGRIQGIGVWKDTELHAVASGTWYRWNGSSWVSLVSGLNSTSPWYFCNFQGNLPQISLMATNGIDTPRYYNGSSVTTLSNVPANASFMDQHDNRLYAAKDNKVFFSALRKPQDWTTVDEAGEINVETNNGEVINGIKAGSRHLMVFKKSSFHELWGTNPANYQMDTIAADIGLVSNQALTMFRDSPFWVDKNNIYNYGGSRPRSDFAIPIKPYLEQMNQAQLSKICAGNNGKCVYFSIPSASASDPDTILEYDVDFQTWYIWKDLSILHFAGMGTDFYFGQTDGSMNKAGGTTDNGAPISWEWISRPFGGGTLAQRQQWYRMWYVVDIPAGSTMNVHLSRDAEGSNWTLVKTVSGNNLQAGRIIIPVNTVANANWVRVKFSGTGPCEVTEFDYQQRQLPMA